jgi:hypothetical protein
MNLFVELLAQAQPAVSTPTPVPPAVDRLGAGLKAMVEMSGSLNGWALLVLGGTLAVLLSTSYRKPDWPYRAVFFLLLPAVAFLVRTLERGARVQQAYTAMLLRPPTLVAANDALIETNVALDGQMWAFKFAMGFLAFWLLLYVLWWIVIDNEKKTHLEM